MIIEWLTSDVIIILSVFMGLFIILYVRKNVEFTDKNRLTPFREALVPEGFWKRLVLNLSTPHNQSHKVALYHGDYLNSRSSHQSEVLNLSTSR